MRPDFRASDEGTIVRLSPLNKDAQAWLDENVESSSWQWLGCALCMDHRMAGPIIEALHDANFIVEVV